MRFLSLLASFFVSCIVVGSTDTQCPYTNNTSKSVDRRSDKSSLRFVQYNVEWLFVDYYSKFGCPGEACTWTNTSEAKTHLGYVADVIDKLQPDILHLCEVEGCDELNMLLSELDDATYDPFLIKGTDTSTGQNVGLLSRITPLSALYRTESRVDYPIPGSQCGYTGTPGSQSVSKHLITEFDLNGQNVALIGAHLLAYPDDVPRCAEREAQAQVLQDVIWGFISQKTEVMVVGDFNDFDAEVLDKNDNYPISHVLDILKGTFGYWKGYYQLYNVAEKLEKSQRFSDWYDRNEDCVSSPSEFSMIDHVLVTPGLLDKVADIYIYHGYDEFCGKYNSDHYPVVVDFVL